jgi:cysteine desulfurase/selenocysteine lyase
MSKAFFEQIRHDFPALIASGYTYLDSAATMHKPHRVIDALTTFYGKQYATVNRAVYQPALQATDMYMAARTTLARFINAPSVDEVIFTRGTTDGLNMIADSLARSVLNPTSRILVSEMEHHSNLIPWQIAAKLSGASLEPIPVTDEGALRLDLLEQLLGGGGVAVVALTHASNALGTINPIADIATMVHRHGAILVVDGAQAAPHLPIDVQTLGCDAYAFSAHKMGGPTGVGLLWAKKELLEKLPPTRGGGDMVDVVSFSSATWADLPQKFEPGTPPIAEAIGFGAAVDYLSSLPSPVEYEQSLLAYLCQGLATIPGLQLVGTVTPRVPLQCFHIPGIHPLDIATFLDLSQIAVRSGHMCCQPLLSRFSLQALTRISLSFYNTFQDIDRCIEGLQRVVKRLSV